MPQTPRQACSLQIGKKGPTGLYKKWQQSTRGRIQGGGEDEESSVRFCNFLLLRSTACGRPPGVTFPCRVHIVIRAGSLRQFSKEIPQHIALDNRFQARIAISRTHGRGAVVAAGMDAVKVWSALPSTRNVG